MSNNTPRVQLGDLCKDMVTGFEGVCVARTEWLNGCWRVNLQAQKMGKDGQLPEIFAFDEPQVQVLKSAVVKTLANGEPVGSKKTGGPRDAVGRGAPAARR